MVVREDAPDENKVENHEEFVDAQPEAEPVFTVESILVNILEGIGCGWFWMVIMCLTDPYVWMKHNLHSIVVWYAKYFVSPFGFYNVMYFVAFS